MSTGRFKITQNERYHFLTHADDLLVCWGHYLAEDIGKVICFPVPVVSETAKFRFVRVGCCKDRSRQPTGQKAPDLLNSETDAPSIAPRQTSLISNRPRGILKHVQGIFGERVDAQLDAYSLG